MKAKDYSSPLSLSSLSPSLDEPQSMPLTMLSSMLMPVVRALSKNSCFLAACLERPRVEEAARRVGGRGVREPETPARPRRARLPRAAPEELSPLSPSTSSPPLSASESLLLRSVDVARTNAAAALAASSIDADGAGIVVGGGGGGTTVYSSKSSLGTLLGASPGAGDPASESVSVIDLASSSSSDTKGKTRRSRWPGAPLRTLARAPR